MTFETSAILVTRACGFFLVTWSSGSGDENAQGTFRDSHWIFPIRGENFGQYIPSLGRFWVFTRGKCLLFFYIPILGICCEFCPSYSQSWEQYGNISQVIPYIRELLGHVNPNIGELLGSVNTNIGELFRQEKSIKGLLLGHTNPTEGKFLGHGKPFIGEIMWNSCPKIGFGHLFWYYFPKCENSQEKPT